VQDKIVLTEVSAVHGFSDVSTKATSILLTWTAGKPQYGQICIYDSEIAPPFRTSDSPMPSVLTTVVQVMYRILYAQKYGN
jgi:hypothetical protein